MSKGETQIFVEFVMHGNTVKATAIDSVTGMETSIVSAATAGAKP